MIFKLINKCIIVNGIYCPFYYRNEVLQYFDIYLFKYLSPTMKTCSSLTEITISLSRLKNVSNINNRLFNIGSKISFKIYILIVFTFSAVLGLVKRLEYGVNFSYLTGPIKSLVAFDNRFDFFNQISRLSFPNDESNNNFCVFKVRNESISHNFIGNISSIEIDVKGSCNIIKYFLYVYNIGFGPIILIGIVLIDIYLLRFVKKSNKSKLILLKNSTSTITQEKQDEIIDREKNLTKLNIMNTFFLIILRFPESLATIYHIKLNNSYTILSYYYDTENIIELFDFIFLLNPFFQFI